MQKLVDETVLQSLKYIAEHAGQPLTLQDIAEASGYSQYYFSRTFKKSMGISVMEYVRRQNLKLGSEAIIRGKSILEAALDCGYDSHSGFTKAFRKEFGFSPVLLKVMVMQLSELEGGYNMDYIYMERMNVHESKDVLLQKLLEITSQNSRNYDAEVLEYAYSFADQAYRGMKRYSGDEYITHLLNVAILLSSMEADENLVIAGLMCDIFDKTEVSPEEVEHSFDGGIKELLWKMRMFDAEAVDKNTDEAVWIIKLAERLHNMRTVNFMEKEVRRQKAVETIHFFLPLAVKLGNQKLTEELNDLALFYL